MKTNLIAGVFLLALTISCSNEDNEGALQNPTQNDLIQEDSCYEQFIHRHGIVEMMVTGYGYKFGEPTEGNILYKTTYNQDGFLLDSLIYHKNGVLASLHNSYNDQNKLLVSEIQDSIGNIQQKVERTYDIKGNVLTFQLNQSGVVLYSQKMLYDDKDRIIKITEFDKDGAPQIITNYQYNEKGKLIENEQADALGNILEKTLYVYDEKGRNTVQTIYGGTGQVIEKNFLKEYDQNDNAQLIEKYDQNDSLIVTYTYQYDAKGKEIKSIIYNGIGQIIRQSMATVDVNGDQVLYEVYEGGKGLIGKDERKYNDNHQEIELIVYDHKENQLKRKVSSYNEKGLLKEIINYDKIDEPLFRMTFDYQYHE
ncbi:MAG: hypothetical protein H6598_03330 [Flavobacteriales bacterium]|nr:hypothetical protein [Flavobacteriales bacterium]